MLVLAAVALLLGGLMIWTGIRGYSLGKALTGKVVSSG